MKTCKLIVLLIAVVFVSCKKTHVQPVHKQPAIDLTIHTNHGHITQDFGMCPICGGYFVNFDNDTSTMYRSLRALDKFGITSTSQFPIEATISWQQDSVIRLPNYITITSLKIDH